MLRLFHTEVVHRLLLCSLICTLTCSELLRFSLKGIILGLKLIHRSLMVFKMNKRLSLATLQPVLESNAAIALRHSIPHSLVG